MRWVTTRTVWSFAIAIVVAVACTGNNASSSLDPLTMRCAASRKEESYGDWILIRKTCFEPDVREKDSISKVEGTLMNDE